VKKKELYSYIFWGVLSTILNIGLAQLAVWSGIDYKISNAITLVLVKVFCYFTNKIFVFRTPFGSFHKFITEIVRFVFARWITFLVDYFGVILLVEVMKQSFFSKCVLSVIVIVLNYILSKKMVFYKQRENGIADESIQ